MSKSADTTQRAAFEAWARTLDMDLTPIPAEAGHLYYSDCNTDYAWQAWQASRKQMAEEAIAAVAEVMKIQLYWEDETEYVLDAIRQLSSPEGGL